MKKRVLVIFVLLFISTFLISVSASSHIPGNIPGSNLAGSLGEIDPNTGLPSKFSDFKEKADLFKAREQDNDYLKREWTKILAKNRIMGPTLFYTHKFFSFFNPLWKVIFGVEFSWSWFFFIALGLWIILIILVYYPSKELFKSKLFGLIGAIVIASLMGNFGVISKTVEFATPLISNIFILIIMIIIAVLLVILYQKVMDQYIKESKEEELERAKETIMVEGKIVRRERE